MNANNNRVSSTIENSEEDLANQTETCMWVITPLKSMEAPSATSAGTHVIVFTVEEMHVPCHTAFFRLYDGVPEVMARNSHWDRRNHVLASYCSEYSSPKSEPLVVEARSGYLTVLLQRRSPLDGFVGNYEVLSCPDRPGHNRVCEDKKPVCAVSCHFTVR